MKKLIISSLFMFFAATTILKADSITFKKDDGGSEKIASTVLQHFGYTFYRASEVNSLLNGTGKYFRKTGSFGARTGNFICRRARPIRDTEMTRLGQSNRSIQPLRERYADPQRRLNERTTARKRWQRI